MTQVELYEHIRHHHELVKSRGYETVMTVLIGSQNYKLDTVFSDIDTFTFVMPSFDDLAFAREPVSGEFEVEDGKCMYKDIRLALNLLKKTSPNSVECFLGEYRIFSQKYNSILKKYLENNLRRDKMVHCNYSHMLYAMAGMSHQLTKRNMPAGKRAAHAIRLHSMAHTFMESLDTSCLLKLLPQDYEEAYEAKNVSTLPDEYYNDACNHISSQLDELRETFVLTPYKEEVQKQGLKLIEDFQRELFTCYLTNNGGNDEY